MVANDEIEVTRLLRQVDQRTERFSVLVIPADPHMGQQHEDLGAGCLRRGARLVGGDVRARDLDGPEAAWERQFGDIGVGDTDDRDLDAVQIEHGVVVHARDVVVAILEIGRNVCDGITQLRTRSIGGDVQMVLETSDTSVEVVVPQRVGIDTHQPHRPNRRLVVEEVRQRRRCPHGVTCGEDERVRVVGFFLTEVRRQLRCAAKRAFSEDEQRVELSVPIRERDELDVNRFVILTGCSRRRRRQYRNGEHCGDYGCPPAPATLPWAH